MNFNIRKASDHNFTEKREILTIDELKELAKEFAEPGDEYQNLIIDFSGGVFTKEPEIMIYDDYVE